jgi:hypothetical protein
MQPTHFSLWLRPQCAKYQKQPTLFTQVRGIGILGSSSVSHYDTYVGPRVFSEPETRAVRNLVARELFRGVIT